MDDEADNELALKETGFWGRRGSGCLVMARSTGRFLLALRSLDSLEPLTWGIWGGAIPEGVDPGVSALREMVEETQYDGDSSLSHLHTFSDASSGFRYDTFLTIVSDEFTPVLNWENQDFAWVAESEWPSPLHFGLEDLLKNIPNLASVVEAAVVSPKP